jgi:hypothetical protein
MRIVPGGMVVVDAVDVPDAVALVGAAGPTSTVVRDVPWPLVPVKTGGG